MTNTTYRCNAGQATFNKQNFASEGSLMCCQCNSGVSSMFSLKGLRAKTPMRVTGSIYLCRDLFAQQIIKQNKNALGQSMPYQQLINQFLKTFLGLVMFFVFLVSPVQAGLEVGEEVPNYVRADISGFDFHDQDLSKSSIAGAVARDANFSGVDLHGTVLTLSDLKGSNLQGVDLTDTLSDRVNFQKTDLSNAVLTNMIASGSSFAGAKIDGADFTFAVLDSDDQRNLCKVATGTNPKTGITTRDSLECSDQEGGYKPPMPGT